MPGKSVGEKGGGGSKERQAGCGCGKKDPVMVDKEAGG